MKLCLFRTLRGTLETEPSTTARIGTKAKDAEERQVRDSVVLYPITGCSLKPGVTKAESEGTVETVVPEGMTKFAPPLISPKGGTD